MNPSDLFLLLFSFVFLFLYYHYFHFTKPKAQGPQLPPGPKGWPILGNLPQLGPKPHQTLHTLAKAYGPLLHLRLGSVDVVVASSPGIAAEFLQTHDANFSSRPPNSSAQHVAYNYQDMVWSPYSPRWRMLRKLSAQHLLGPKAMDDLRYVREEELLVLVRMLHARAGGPRPVNLGGEVHMCSTNALSRAMVGRRVFARVEEGEEERRKAEEFRELVVEVLTLAGAFPMGDFVPVLRLLDIGGVVRRMKRAHRRYDKFVDGLIDECRAAAAAEGGERRKDLLSVLLGVKGEEDGDGGRITDDNIKALLQVKLISS